MRYGSILAIPFLGSLPVFGAAINDVSKRGANGCAAPGSGDVTTVVIVDPVYINTYCEVNTVFTIYEDITVTVTNAPTIVEISTYYTATTTVTKTETIATPSPYPVTVSPSPTFTPWTVTVSGTTVPASNTPSASPVPAAPSWTIPDDLTVQQAQNTCGDNTVLSCCNKATYSGDTITSNSGLLSGLLSDLVGSGSGSQGLGLFDQCSKFPLNLGILGVGLDDLLNRQCQSTAACCQNSSSTATGLIAISLPCIALGSLL